MIVVDIESSSLSPTEGSILSIGSVDFIKPSNQFYIECKAWEGAELDPESLEVTGFTFDTARDSGKKTETEAIIDFLSWVNKINERTLAGHNPHFDIAYLIAACDRANIVYNLGHRYVDMHSEAYTRFLKSNMPPPTEFNRSALKSDKIFEYVGLYSEPKPHNAMIGAKMEAEAFSRLIYGKNLLEEFKQFAVPQYLVRA